MKGRNKETPNPKPIASFQNLDNCNLLDTPRDQSHSWLQDLELAHKWAYKSMSIQAKTARYKSIRTLAWVARLVKPAFKGSECLMRRGKIREPHSSA